MKKRFISIVVCLSLVLSLNAPAMAAGIAEEKMDGSVSFATSSTGRIEIILKPMDITTKKEEIGTASGYDFEIRQYEENELVQTVVGSAGGEKLFSTDYKEGKIIKEEIINVADKVVWHKKVEGTAQTEGAARAQTLVGTIKYNKTVGSDIEEVIKVYSEITNEDSESFTVNGEKIDSLIDIVGAIISVAAMFLPAKIIGTVARKVAIALVVYFGGSIVADQIGVTFSERVSVDATYYTLNGYHAITGRYSSDFDGVARQVKTKSSSYYNEWFYEDFTPQTWKDEDNLAICLWNEMIGGIWPFVKSYT